MDSYKGFTTKNPKIIYQLCMLLDAIFVLIMVIFTLTDPEPQLAMYVVIIIFMILPFSVAGIWSKRKCIRVNGTTITVQNGLALRPFQIHVSEITRVKCIVAHTNMGENVNMTVYAANGRKFGVESTMINSQKMVAYINAYVGSDKIQTIHKKIAS